MKLTLAQLNVTVGDVLGNIRKIRETYLDADERGIDVVIFPELAVTGYPAEDLVEEGDLLDAAEAGLAVLQSMTKGRNAAIVIGSPVRADAKDKKGIYNAALVFSDGTMLGAARKKNLPNYGVFDETRNFIPETNSLQPVTVKGKKLGILICEDAWLPEPAAELKANGAELLVAVNASPFRPEVLQTRIRDVAALRIAETGLPLAYVNLFGGQDELVFDGGSFFMDARGRRVRQAPQWEECVIDCDCGELADGSLDAAYPDPMEEIWRAMVVGLGDYGRKSGFTDVVLGLSGGLDSAVVAAVAGDAFGPERVHCVRLPSRFTSDLSNSTAEDMCRTWGFDMRTVAIGSVVDAAQQCLSTATDGKELKKLTYENMQARARGYLLMTLSNEYNWLLLSTGNKSEIAVGYATLYGDMCGGYNPLKDVFKTTAFALAKWRNAHCPAGLLGPSGVVIPEEIITRPPSAELSDGQLDTDSLPPYPILDGILRLMVEDNLSLADIARQGYEIEMVKRVYRMLIRAEYKRRQSAPGPKTSGLAFARERRMPIVNRFDVSQIQALEGL